jgi:hypothetical protein
MKLLVKISKFILGWTVWILIFLISLVFNIIVWNWKETITMDMEKIVIEICGKSTWNVMIFNKFK